MKNKIIVIAPHPDDETFGCGGFLLKEKKFGSKIYWINITSITEKYGWQKDKIIKRNKEIIKVANKYKFDSYFNLDYPTTKLDTFSINDIIENLSAVILKIKPNIILIPNAYDIHTDHQITAKAAIACTKWFRYPFIKKCLSYETLSETHLSQGPKFFKPNVFIDITKNLDKKIEIMNIYKSEIENFPFPRSETAIRALANFRGSTSGFIAAEAFELLFERI